MTLTLRGAGRQWRALFACLPKPACCAGCATAAAQHRPSLPTRWQPSRANWWLHPRAHILPLRLGLPRDTGARCAAALRGYGGRRLVVIRPHNDERRLACADGAGADGHINLRAPQKTGTGSTPSVIRPRVSSRGSGARGRKAGHRARGKLAFVPEETPPGSAMAGLPPMRAARLSAQRSLRAGSVVDSKPAGYRRGQDACQHADRQLCREMDGPRAGPLNLLVPSKRHANPGIPLAVARARTPRGG